MIEHGSGPAEEPATAHEATPAPVTEGPRLGDRQVVDGAIYEYKQPLNANNQPYTLKTYYSHETDGFGPGPGWDYRRRLENDDYAMRRHGRTFTPDEVSNPALMPDEPFYDWQVVGFVDEESPDVN